TNRPRGVPPPPYHPPTNPTRRVSPQDIRVPITVEVADVRDYGCRGYAPDIVEAGDNESIHQPDHDVACGIAPKDVRSFIIIEIANADNGPSSPDVGDRAEAGDRRSVH